MTCAGTVELDMLFHDRRKLNQELVESISPAAHKWGLEVGWWHMYVLFYL